MKAASAYHSSTADGQTLMPVLAELFVALLKALMELLVVLIDVLLEAVFFFGEFLFVLVIEGFSNAKEKSKARWKQRTKSQIKKCAEEDGEEALNVDSEPMHVQLDKISLFAFTAFLLVCGTIVGSVIVVQKIQKRRIEKTELQVEQIASRIQADASLGNPIPVQGDLGDIDAWSQPIQIVVKEGVLGKSIEVRSIGPDGEFETLDDISSSRLSVNTPREISDEIFDRGKEKLER